MGKSLHNDVASAFVDFPNVGLMPNIVLMINEGITFIGFDLTLSFEVVDFSIAVSLDVIFLIDEIGIPSLVEFQVFNLFCFDM